MKVRKAYNKMAKGKAIACDLGQNIVFAMFCDERCLFTLIRGMGVIWSVQDNRWLCASELLSSMGWPVTPGSQRATLTTTHFSESHEGAASRTSDVSEATNASTSSLRTSSTLLSPLEMVRSIRRKVHNETGL